MRSEDWFAIFFWGCIFFLGIRYEYIKYLERKKKEKALAAQIKLKDLKNMSKEQLDSISYGNRSRLMDEALKKWKDAPAVGSESIKARKEFFEVANLLGANIKPGELF